MVSMLSKGRSSVATMAGSSGLSLSSVDNFETSGVFGPQENVDCVGIAYYDEWDFKSIYYSFCSICYENIMDIPWTPVGYAYFKRPGN